MLLDKQTEKQKSIFKISVLTFLYIDCNTPHDFAALVRKMATEATSPNVHARQFDNVLFII